MITGNKTLFLNRLAERGYTLEDVKDCIINEEGVNITVDENHPSYPKYAKTHGVGTELKKILKHIGITASPNCSCNARAKMMDDNGIEWCENNIDTIIGWLKEEAHNRHLPFVEIGARILVKKAIKNAKNN